jgi:translation initiation factor IF-3
VNERIRAPMVRVIGEDGSQIGIMAVSEALRMARDKELDLVEVAPQARPPVCRVMDYGRYQYEQSKRLRKARQKMHQAQLKEVKMSPKIEEHDFQTKLRHAREFLEKRDKVKFIVRFRGREIVHLEFGEALLRKAMQELQDVAVVESALRREGHLLTLVMSPKHGA